MTLAASWAVDAVAADQGIVADVADQRAASIVGTHGAAEMVGDLTDLHIGCDSIAVERREHPVGAFT